MSVEPYEQFRQKINGPHDDTPTVPTPRVWNATDLLPATQPRWLAKRRIMRGAVNILVGDEGIGKSLFWVWLAALVTTGNPAPGFGVPSRSPQDVLLVITEDSWTDTVRPRLEVAGADLDRIKVVCVEPDGSGTPVFPLHIGLIEQCPTPPGLIVVDTWLDTVPSGIKVKDPHDARKALHPWKELATRTGAAILLLSHTNRVQTANARDRYGVTAELRKKARVTLYCQMDDDENERHLLVGPDKMNAAAAVNASAFGIRPIQFFDPTDDDDGTIPKLTFINETNQTAAGHVADTFKAGNSDSDEAVSWLTAQLVNGPRWATEIEAAADSAGITNWKLRSAKKRLRVESGKSSSRGAWYWLLATHRGREPQ
ncbi:AAA family ATPase [Mycobacterium syngnathidarum]